MDRRTFLKAVSSFAVLLPWAGQKAFAQNQQLYRGPFLICIHANGGWDTTLFFDPKAPFNGTPVNRAYREEVKEKSDIPSWGPFRYAPVRFEETIHGNLIEVHSPERFLKEHGGDLLLLNGVDVESNAHPVGTQKVWSGHTATDYPSVGALLAAKASQNPNLDLPCAYLVNYGGYVQTLGLVPITQVNHPGILKNISNPERIAGAGSNFFSAQTSQRIRQAHATRVQRLNQQFSLPESTGALGRYNEAMLARNGLEPLVAKLDETPRITFDNEMLRPEARHDNGTTVANPGNINGVLQQAELALLGFSTGTMVSASISMGDFDSHSNNDNRQRAQLSYLFVLIEYILKKARALALPNLFVVVGSDFARDYRYNEDNYGKEHWGVSSFMLFGPGIRGNRVIGATKDNLYPEYVNPQNPAQLSSKESGILLQPAHVHHALRRVLGLSEFNANFGLLGEDIALF